MRFTNVSTQKIDSTTLETYEIVIVVFSVIYQVNQVRFFEKTFLMANIDPNVILEILFLTLSDADIDFLQKKL